ncbi:MAG: glycosyltransferase family 4 protein [Chloroflexi bacterium]|nr:glycosyltransferase family 4 protein [Chloroflexota bacterium]
MKIALLSEKYTPDIGGLAISAGRLGHLLASAGHEVRVFAPTLGLPASEKRSLPHNGVSVTRFGARKRVDDTLVDWLELILEEHKRAPFDVLNAYFLPQAGFVATYAGKYLGIPSVVSIRGNDIERAAFDPSKFSHVMYALQNADAVTTNASELTKKAKAFVDREIFLIPNGIDTDHFRPLQKNAALAESLELGDLLVIGFSGELREKKGLRALLRGYAKLNAVRPTALLIVGDVRAGEDKQAFDELRASIPNSQIVITGFVSHKDIPSFYSLMDVFVHPSLRDGMPNALLEAMACEKSVIATPVGGIMDIVENEKNGMLIHINDENALTDKVCELLDDHEKRQRLGKAARETIEGRFTLANELKANLDVYRNLGLKV